MVMGDVGEDVVIDVSVVHASEEEVGSAVMVEVFLWQFCRDVEK